MARNIATLRAQVETALAGRVASPFSYRDRRVVETVSTAIPEIDALTGGLPRGSLTEIYGPACSGRTTLLVSALASRTEEEVCALVDGCDSFDPQSAQAAGVKLEKLLWVRCRTVDQSLRATDLLIQGGGFGIVALDLSDFPLRTTRQIPLNAWFHLRRAVEDTKTILLVLEQEAHAKTCASLVLHMGMQGAEWAASLGPSLREAAQNFCPPSSWLLDGFRAQAEMARSRVQPGAPFGKSESSIARQEPFVRKEEDHAGIFQSRPPWSIALNAHKSGIGKAAVAPPPLQPQPLNQTP